MFTDKIPQHTQQLLGLLNTVCPAGSYLAGGTALALHLNHRSSFDLDIYSPTEFDTESVKLAWEQKIPDFELSSSEWQTIHGYSIDTELSLFLYPYPNLEPAALFTGFPIASVADIAAMKLEAIAGRGLKRDFYDLFEILGHKSWDLKTAIELNQRKYSRDGSNIPHLLKSLTYFDDADTKPERAQIVDETWEKVKLFFSEETAKLTRILLGE